MSEEGVGVGVRLGTHQERDLEEPGARAGERLVQGVGPNRQTVGSVDDDVLGRGPGGVGERSLLEAVGRRRAVGLLRRGEGFVPPQLGHAVPGMRAVGSGIEQGGDVAPRVQPPRVLGSLLAGDDERHVIGEPVGHELFPCGSRSALDEVLHLRPWCGRGAAAHGSITILPMAFRSIIVRRATAASSSE